jgi:hypothetical protein
MGIAARAGQTKAGFDLPHNIRPEDRAVTEGKRAFMRPRRRRVANAVRQICGNVRQTGGKSCRLFMPFFATICHLQGHRKGMIYREKEVANPCELAT